ncbi:MAG: nucleoside triphosphate pyrophosphatase [Candidatus Petromonas sp.]|jgi:septum formation protein|nr:nucleoside triphosphate pyrophosphatase [Candidatus Petromonas sp.]
MKKVILASSSPRRKEILKNLDFEFETFESNLRERVRDDESPQQIVMALALEKALNVCEKIDEDSIIIAADTIVFKDGVLGKPRNYNEAYNMLLALQGSEHYVYSGLAVVEKNSFKKYVTFEKTKVKIKKLSDSKIKKYIETGEVWDKAGAYAIQGYGSIIVEYIEGDYFNVVGLPVSKLEDLLYKHFNISLLK